jgi:hypothetical protein
MRATLTGAALTLLAAANLATIKNITTNESGIAIVLGVVAAVFGLSLLGLPTYVFSKSRWAGFEAGPGRR